MQNVSVLLFSICFWLGVGEKEKHGATLMEEEKKTMKEGNEKKKKQIAFAVAVRNYPPGCLAANLWRFGEI